jgi:hypothetical protein
MDAWLGCIPEIATRFISVLLIPPFLRPLSFITNEQSHVFHLPSNSTITTHPVYSYSRISPLCHLSSAVVVIQRLSSSWEVYVLFQLVSLPLPHYPTRFSESSHAHISPSFLLTTANKQTKTVLTPLLINPQRQVRIMYKSAPRAAYGAYVHSYSSFSFSLLFSLTP